MNTNDYELKDKILEISVLNHRNDDRPITIYDLSIKFNEKEYKIHRICDEMDSDYVIKHHYSKQNETNYIEVIYKSEELFDNGGYTKLYKEKIYNDRFKLMENSEGYDIRFGDDMEQIHIEHISDIEEFGNNKDYNNFDGVMSLNLINNGLSVMSIDWVKELIESTNGITEIKQIYSNKDNKKIWYYFSLTDEFKDSKHIKSLFGQIHRSLNKAYLYGAKYDIVSIIVSGLNIQDINFRNEIIINMGNVNGDGNKIIMTNKLETDNTD
jgi:hypothetical protein